MRVLFTSHELSNLPASTPPIEGVELVGLSHETVPSLEQLREYDTLCIVGTFPSPERERQLAGTVRLALPEGLVVVVAYPQTLAGAAATFTEALGVPPARSDFTQNAYDVIEPNA